MNLQIEIDREDDGRRIASVPALPGVHLYGLTREEAIARVEVLAHRAIADHFEHRQQVDKPKGAGTT